MKTVDFSNDTERFVTGCQDGIIRVYNTCIPDVAPLQLNYSNVMNNTCNTSVVDPVTRVQWGNKENNDIIYVGRRSGNMELWDLRCNFSNSIDMNCNKPTISKQVATSTIIDIELSNNNSIVNDSVMWLAASKQVHVLGKDLSILKSYTMPDTMNFNEEGGVSVHPSGKTFMAVSILIHSCIIIIMYIKMMCNVIIIIIIYRVHLIYG